MTLQIASASAVVLDEFSRAWAPREPLSTAEWAQRHRRLSSKVSAEPGRWQNERIPYLRAIMDALDETDPCHTVVLKKSSQVGGSELAVNWLDRCIMESPSGILCLFPTQADGRKWMRTRVEPSIAECPPLRALIPPGRRGPDSSTLSEKSFPGGVLFVGSANVPSDVAAVSVQRVLLDEVDRMPLALDGEGDPVELAKRRTTTYALSKVFEVSSPTTEEASRIHADYLTSSQDRYHVPCPHCAHMQPLVWDHLAWPDGEPEKAAYRCEECSALIDEHEKTAMLAAGEWRSTVPERRATVRGFHVNCLYTPLGLGETWGEHAAAWIDARKSPEKMQVFANTRLGEVVKGERVRIEWEAVHGRREGYRMREVPKGILLLTAGCDVQHDRIEAQILGWGRGERLAVIDHEAFYGDTTLQDVWTQLDEYLAKEMRNSAGATMRLACTLIDAGYAQHQVTNFTRSRRARRIYASKGSSMAGRSPIGKPKLVDVQWRGQVDAKGAELYVLGVSELKRILYERLRADEKALPADRLIRFPEDLQPEYFRQLSSEVYTRKDGWSKVYDRNEALDTMVYAMAAGMHHTVSVHKMRDIDWDRLAESQEGAAKGTQRNEKLGVDSIPLRGGGFMPTAAPVAGSSLAPGLFPPLP